LIRPSGDRESLLQTVGAPESGRKLEILTGNLLSPGDCEQAARDVEIVFHLAAGTGSKSFADAYLNSVVTTRNLLEAVLNRGRIRRFVSTSSFAVYSNRNKPNGRLLDESSAMESNPGTRAEAYCYAKVKQDELLIDYGRSRNLPFVLIRPGVVFGPGKTSITGRVGTDSFGIFLHLGGGNPIPLTYVDNCADAIVLAGFAPGIEQEIFNVVDDDIPTSRAFLRMYKNSVRRLRSVYVPKAISYALCWMWEAYSRWSWEQLPPVFTRREWHATWKRTRYSNSKLKSRLGWKPRVPMSQALQRYFDGCRERIQRA